MDAHTPDICLVHPNRTNTHRTVDAFVDDTNSGLTTDGLHSFLPQPMAPVAKHDTIYDQTVANVQFYNDLLSSSGGKLALHKSYAYVLTTKWNHGQRLLNETQRYLPPLPIYQHQNQHDMHLLSPKTSRKMLGVHTASDGNSKE